MLYDDENDVVVGHARTLPTREADGLPNGIDGVLELWVVRNPDASLVRYQVPEVPGTDPRSWVPGSCAAP